MCKYHKWKPAKVNILPAKPFTYFEKGKLKYKDDPGGQGWEAVREIVVCAACAEQRQGISGNQK